MGKKRGILLTVLLVALLGGLIQILSRPTEPLYQGKPLSAWLNELHYPVDTNQAAFAAFREMGTKAIPTLLKIIESDDSQLQRLMWVLNSKQSLVRFPIRETEYQRWAASWALYSMGTNARPAFPALTNLLFDPKTLVLGANPAVSLAGMGPEGLPPLLAALTNQNSWIRSSAATALCLERSDLSVVVPALITRLSDRDWAVHCEAVRALGQLHAEPGLTVPALMKDFASNHPGPRGLILTGIGRFETNAKAAVPMLLEALSDNHEYVRNQAATALKQIDPAAAAKAGLK
jgi:HEAT repeat protein